MKVSIYKHFLLFMSVSTEKFQKLSNSLEIGKRLFKIQNTEWPKSNLKQAILMVWIISWNQYSWQLVSKNLYFDIFTATTDLLKSVDLKTPWMRKSMKTKSFFFLVLLQSLLQQIWIISFLLFMTQIAVTKKVRGR